MKMRTIYHSSFLKVLVFLYLVISTSFSLAQPSFSKENFKFETFNLPGGALANQVQQVTQDRHGFLWFATKNGLVKYDGLTFKTFQHEPDNANSLPINFVESLFFDSEEMLWIGTYGKGVVRFDTQSEEFSTPVDLKEWITLSKNTYVYTLEEDNEKNIWIGTNGGLVKYNLNTKSANYFTEDPQNPAALNCNIVWNLYKDKAGTIWVATGFPWLADQSGGLHKYNPSTNTFTRFLHLPNQSNSLSDNRVRAIFEDSQDNFWVGTMEEGLHKMNRSQGTFEKFDKQTNPTNGLSRPYVLDDKFSEKNFSQVTFVHEDALGRLWIGAFNGGLNIYDPSINEQLHFEFEQANENGLPTNYLFNIFETADNTIFISTGDAGGNQLIKVSYSANLFQNILLPQKDNSKGHLQSIAEDNAGNIWLGTMHSEGLFRWNSTSNTINSSTIPLSAKDINALSLDQLGRLWIGFNDAGLALVNPTNLKTLELNLPASLKQEISTESINTIFQDSRGNIWIPRREKGIILVKKDQSIVPLSKNATEGLALIGTTIDRILEDENGHVFLFGNTQTLDGIYTLTIEEYNPKTNTITSHLQPRQEVGFINSVDQDRDGIFWFSNGLDGIKKFNPKTGHITTINTTNSRIPSDEILAVVVAESDLVWMQTKKEIIAYDPALSSFRTFDVLDGVNIELSYGSILERKNGQILFGGKNGFLVLDPNNLDWQQQFKKPLIKVTDLKIDNHPILIQSELLGGTPIWEQNQLTFEHHENNFSFSLNCIDYHDKESYVEYFLENYDSYWRRVGPEQTAHYVNVVPGNYTLKTRGANYLGNWNGEGQAIDITVNAPWWTTWWAYLGYLMIGGGLMYGFYRFQLKRQVERQEAQNLKEIDTLKTKLYANITHEFRTPLTLILGNAQQVQKETYLEETTVTKIKNIEKSGHQLLRLVTQLLDIRKLESKEEKVKLVQGDIIPVLNNIIDSFGSLAVSRGINYQAHLPLGPLVMDYDVDKLQKVIANLISNAIKFTTKGDSVSIICQRVANDLIISVKDSGVGIAPADMPNIFNRFYRSENTHQISGTGIGLALSKELIDLMNWTIRVDSKLGIGSEFTLAVPVTTTAPTLQTSDLAPLYVPADSEIPELITENETTDLPIVLIVEDNVDVAEFTASCLQENYTIHFAENGQIGVEKAIEIIPDLIVSDVMMPLKDGFQLCEELKQTETTAHIPIILLTAKADIEDKLAGLERGADAYLAKPFHEKELKIRIQQLIQLREKLKERYAALTLKKPSTDKALKLDDEFVLKVRATIEEHLDDEKFGVEELSKAIYLSRAQVHRKLKALTGKSTGQFIHTIRLHHALSYLQTSDRSITAIAFDVGYNDPSYFTRMFTREFGNPPSYFSQKV